MKASEIKELSSAELAEKIASLKQELVKMQLNHAVSSLENPMKIRSTRRVIARLMTSLNNRQEA